MRVWVGRHVRTSVGRCVSRRVGRYGVMGYCSNVRRMLERTGEA